MEIQFSIFDFAITPANCAEMSRTAEKILSQLRASARTKAFACLFIEDILMLVVEKTQGRRSCAPRVR